MLSLSKFGGDSFSWFSEVNFLSRFPMWIFNEVKILRLLLSPRMGFLRSDLKLSNFLYLSYIYQSPFCPAILQDGISDNGPRTADLLDPLEVPQNGKDRPTSTLAFQGRASLHVLSHDEVDALGRVPVLLGLHLLELLLVLDGGHGLEAPEVEVVLGLQCQVVLVYAAVQALVRQPTCKKIGLQSILVTRNVR